VSHAIVAAVEAAGLVSSSSSSSTAGNKTKTKTTPVIGALAVHPAGFINVTLDPVCLFANVEQLVKDGKAKPPQVVRGCCFCCRNKRAVKFRVILRTSEFFNLDCLPLFFFALTSLGCLSFFLSFSFL